MKEKLQEAILKAVNDYLADEEAYGDAAQLRIDRGNWAVEAIADPDEDRPECDYYDMLDLVEMSADGSWKPDTEAIAEIAGSFQSEIN